MPSLAQQPCEYPLRDRRIAMLVIHGIGQQNPYETLDSFARRLSLPKGFLSRCQS